VNSTMNQSTKLDDKVIVITGATSGIGYAAARELAGRGALVIGVGRSEARCLSAEAEIRESHPDAQIGFRVADLSAQGHVRALAAQIREWAGANASGKIDVLINNAAMVTNRYMATEDGYETQFAVNHLAGFLLTHELLPLLAAARAARILTVSSNSHRRKRIHWRDPMMRRRYNILLAYKQSKLANVMFSAEFNRRFAAATSMRAYAIDPGLVNTGIGSKDTRGIVRWIWENRRAKGVSPEQGAETVVYIATDPAVAGSQEVYWKDCQPVPPSEYALREREAARLWEYSERLCGI